MRSRLERSPHPPAGRLLGPIVAAFLLGGCAGAFLAQEAPTSGQAGSRTAGSEAQALRAHESSLSLLESIGHIRHAHPHSGQEPLPDRALAVAAAELARHAALEGGAAQAIESERVRLALTRAGSSAAQVYPLVVRATTRGAAISRIQQSARALTADAEAFTHVGAGAAGGDGKEQTLVLLLARSFAVLEPIEPSPSAGTRLSVRGQLAPSLRGPELYVISPDGRPSRIPLAVTIDFPHEPRPDDRPATGARVGFQGTVVVGRPGRWILEVLGDGDRGPVVAAVQHIYVGGEIPRVPRLSPTISPARGTGKPSVAEEEQALAAAVNRLRAREGLGPLLVDPVLSRVARGYAEELRTSGTLAHRSERSGAVADRLRRAGYRSRSVGENLAQAASASEAQRSLEASPRHLQLLLGAQWREAGYGVAIQEGPTGARTVIVVQIVTVPH